MKESEQIHLDPTSTFVTHSCHELGTQALEILRQYTDKTRVISSGDPVIVAGEVVFIKLTVGECRSTFLRIHPAVPVETGDVERQRFLETNFPWALRGRVVFINPLHAKCKGRFGGGPFLGFTMALSQLAGYKNLTARERRKERWRTWVQTRTGRVREGMRM